MARINEIQIIRGLEADLPVGGELEGELRYATDTKKLYIDDGTNNVLLGTNEVATDMNTVVETALDSKQTVFPGICQEQFLTENDIIIDCVSATPTLTIATVKNGTVITPSNPLCFYTDGNGVATKHTIPNPVSVAFTYTTGTWYFYFNSAGQLIATQTPWTDFSSIATVYRLYINDTLVGQARNVVESIEFHKNDISWTDHMWKHAQGTIWVNGGDVVSNLLTISGTGVPTSSPNVNGSNTVISLSSLTNEDDNMPYTVTNSLNPTLKFNQDLGSLTAGSLTSANSALFKIRTNDASGRLFFLPATRYPFPWDTATNRPEYITASGVRTLVTDNRWFVTYVYALQDPRNGEAIKVVPEITDFTSYVNAQASTWENLKSTYVTIRDNEIRPLYKLIFFCDSSGGGAYSASCKYSALVKIDDLRSSKVSSVSSASGSLLGTSVVITPAGNISATNVQGAIEELDLEKEPANANIQSHISSTLNPHSVTQTQVGLGNVTNNAQVKKVASSTDNAIMRWDGTTGDLPLDSLATISDTGTVNIPTGQNYNINGVNLKDVSETLTNKTLTSPVLNTEVTGTGITTTGEVNKLLKINSNGTTVLGGTSSMISGMTGTTPKLIIGHNQQSVFLNKTYSSGSPAPAGIISVGRSRSATIGTESTTLTGDSLGYYVFEGVGSGNTPVIGASIEAIQIGASGTAYVPADIIFKTCTSTVQSEAMRITSTGKMGLAGASFPKSHIQIGNKANIFNGAGITAANWLDLGYNIYYDGGYKYTAGAGGIADEATLLEIGAGGMGFYTAVAGVADATVPLTKRFQVTKDTFQVPLLAGSGLRMVVADASGNLSANSIFLRGYISATSGSTTTVTLPETMPAATYAILLTADRSDYNGAMIMTTRDKLLNEFKIHYWAADEGSATISWFLSY